MTENRLACAGNAARWTDVKLQELNSVFPQPSVCLSVSLHSVCLSVSLHSVCLFLSTPSVCLSVSLHSVCLSVSLHSVCLKVCVFLVPAGSPTRGGDAAVYVFEINQPSFGLAHSFLFCSCVYFCLYGPFNCISFRKFSRQLSAFSLRSFGLIYV